jgi:hypothetical protein
MNLLSSEDKLAHSLPHSSKIQIDNWKEIKDTTVLHTLYPWHREISKWIGA